MERNLKKDDLKDRNWNWRILMKEMLVNTVCECYSGVDWFHLALSALTLRVWYGVLHTLHY